MDKKGREVNDLFFLSSSLEIVNETIAA